MHRHRLFTWGTARTRARATAVAVPVLLGGVAVVSQWLLLAPWLLWPLLLIGAALALVQGTWLARSVTSIEAAPRSDLPQLLALLDQLRLRGETSAAIMLCADHPIDGSSMRRELAGPTLAALVGMLDASSHVTGWDPFTVLAVVGATDERELIVRAGLVREALAAAIDDDETVVSAGWATCPEDAPGIELLVQRALLAMHTCRREHPGTVHRTATTDAWLDGTDAVTEVQRLIAKASELRGAPAGRHHVVSELARAAALELGCSTLEATIAATAALIWDDRLAGTYPATDRDAAATNTAAARDAHVEQAIEMLERYGVLERPSLTEEEELCEAESRRRLARLIAIVDDQLHPGPGDGVLRLERANGPEQDLVEAIGRALGGSDGEELQSAA